MSLEKIMAAVCCSFCFVRYSCTKLRIDDEIDIYFKWLGDSRSATLVEEKEDIQCSISCANLTGRTTGKDKSH